MTDYLRLLNKKNCLFKAFF